MTTTTSIFECFHSLENLSVILSASQYLILIVNRDIQSCPIDFSFQTISIYKVTCKMNFKHESVFTTVIFTSIIRGYNLFNPEEGGWSELQIRVGKGVGT